MIFSFWAKKEKLVGTVSYTYINKLYQWAAHGNVDKQMMLPTTSIYGNSGQFSGQPTTFKYGNSGHLSGQPTELPTIK